MLMPKKKIIAKARKTGREIARTRIAEFFRLADERYPDNPSLSHRYVTLARKTAMKFQLTMPKELKRKYCTHCYRYLRPGKNARIRTSKNGNVVIACLECKKFTRIPTS